MYHQAAAPDIAVCAEQALPVMLNARRVFPDNQLGQRTR